MGRYLNHKKTFKIMSYKINSRLYKSNKRIQLWKRMVVYVYFFLRTYKFSVTPKKLKKIKIPMYQPHI